MKPEETIDFHVRWAWAKMLKLYNAEAARHGTTMSVGYALLNIDREGTPSTKLGPKMGMEPTSLTRLLNTMENMELIRREKEGKDKRVVLVFLTNKGLKMRDQTRDKVIQFNRYMQSRIDAVQLATFFQVMQQINAMLESDEIFTPEKVDKK